MGFCPRDVVRAANSPPDESLECAVYEIRRSDVALSYLAVDYCC